MVEHGARQALANIVALTYAGRFSGKRVGPEVRAASKKPCELAWLNAAKVMFLPGTLIGAHQIPGRHEACCAIARESSWGRKRGPGHHFHPATHATKDVAKDTEKGVEKDTQKDVEKASEKVAKKNATLNQKASGPSVMV